MVVTVTLDHLMRWVVVVVVAIAETFRAIVVDLVADLVTMRRRQHLVQALLVKEIMVVVAHQTQILIQVVAVVVQVVRALQELE
jgi:hypothetical protein